MKQEYSTELEYLTWFRLNCSFGPGEGDYIIELHNRFEEETGKKIPKEWRNE